MPESSAAAIAPDRTHKIRDFRLASGAVLTEAEIAYVTYGRLAADGANAILVTHGFTSSHRFTDTHGPSGEGSWGPLVGPGKAIDTDRFFVVSSNMLGSSYGSTCPRSIDPRTGRAYGPDFPKLDVRDIVNAQRTMLEAIGVRRLLAVVGPSYGGFQAFVWGISHPDFVDGIVPVISGLRSPRDPGADERLVARFAAHPNWNGGRYYENGGIFEAMRELRVETLLKYGAMEELAASIPDPAERRAEIDRRAGTWATEFDANSLLALMRASQAYDASPDLAKIRARVLYILSRTDKLFPPALSEEVMPALAAAGVDAQYFLLDSAFGHQASGADWAKWAPILRRFIDALRGGRRKTR
ncbi:MAG: alpha/beta fold hydrolase [Alphaproteobacteria bacterium]|nr:alpha/beta fold hydrolase [Alphaproteobacteria bacterium]